MRQNLKVKYIIYMYMTYTLYMNSTIATCTCKLVVEEESRTQYIPHLHVAEQCKHEYDTQCLALRTGMVV